MNIEKLVKCFEKEIEFFELIVSTAKAYVKNNKDTETIDLIIDTGELVHTGTFTYSQAIKSELDEETFAFVIFQSFVEKTMNLMISQILESED